MKLRHLLPTSLLLVTALAACSDDSITGPRTPDDVEFNPALNIDLATFERLPSGVYIKTEATGEGPAAESGDQVTVRYELRSTANTLLDSSPPDLSFILGAGQVIPGFDIGVTGMQVGEQRRIIIPSELGYGGQQVGPIQPNSVLIFTVTLIALG